MERILVYGLMVALLVLVGIEAVGRFSHKSAVDSLAALLKKTDGDADAPEVTETDVKTILGTRQPIRTEQYPSSTSGLAESKKLEVYSFFTLNPLTKRELWIRYARQGLKETGPATVVSVSVDENDAEPVVSADVPAEGTAATDQAPMSAGPPAGMSPPPYGAGPPNTGRRGGQGRAGAAAAGDEAKSDADAPKSGDEKTDDKKADGEKPESEEKKPDAKPEPEKN